MTHKSVTSNHKKITRRTKKEPSEFGENLWNARENLLRWTQKHLSKETRKFGEKEIHYNTIYNLENGNSKGSKETRRVLEKTITAALSREYPWKDDGDTINKNSLAKFIKDSALVNRIDHDFSKAKNSALRVVFSEDFADFFVKRMHLVNIKTIQALEEQLNSNEAKR